MVSFVALTLFLWRTDVRTPCVKIMTTYSAVSWWVNMLLIHSANPQSRILSVRTSTSLNLAKQNKFEVKIMFAIGRTVGLDKGIIDTTCLSLYFFSFTANKIYMDLLQFLWAWYCFIKSTNGFSCMKVIRIHLFAYFFFLSIRFVC